MKGQFDVIYLSITASMSFSSWSPRRCKQARSDHADKQTVQKAHVPLIWRTQIHNAENWKKHWCPSKSLRHHERDEQAVMYPLQIGRQLSTTIRDQWNLIDPLSIKIHHRSPQPLPIICTALQFYLWTESAQGPELICLTNNKQQTVQTGSYNAPQFKNSKINDCQGGKEERHKWKQMLTVGLYQYHQLTVSNGKRHPGQTTHHSSHTTDHDGVRCDFI